MFQGPECTRISTPRCGIVARRLLALGMMKAKHSLTLGACLLAAFVSIAGCQNRETGSGTGSTATGERNQRLGNDPAEQNVGKGSNPSEEVESPGAVPQGGERRP